MRVFVALNLSTAEHARLSQATAGLREAGYPVRWVPPENVHLTLKFLGEVAEGRIAELSMAVDEAAAGVGAFRLAVGGLGAFPSLSRPQVIWVGVQLHATLEALQRSLEDALAERGYPREERHFRPHLTIGRARKGAKPREFQGLEELVARTPYDDAFEIRSVDVMRSRLMPSGALYDVVHSTSLES